MGPFPWLVSSSQRSHRRRREELESELGAAAPRPPRAEPDCPRPAPPSSTWARPGIARPRCPPGTRRAGKTAGWEARGGNTKFKLGGEPGSAPPSLPGRRFRREMPAAPAEFQAVLSRRALAPMEGRRLLCPAAPSCVNPHQHLPLPAETGLGTALAVQWPLLTGPHPLPLGTAWLGLPVAPCGAVHAPLPLCPHQHHLLPPHTVPTCLGASATPDFTQLRGRNVLP